jgi:hypothetical protein|tara:strand:+ start:66 stop:182 length:117 start_codon:yes stop_codon:yes gene_type:complete
MTVKLQKTRYNENKWEKLLYKLEALIDKFEKLLGRFKS